MPIEATIYRVLLATPGDVVQRGDRAAAREAVMDWNASNPIDQHVFLEPVMYDTHVAKDIGKHPQEIINEQVVDEVDMAIGLFWTRVGTPTENNKGGAVEEVKTIAEDRPVIVGFCKAPFDHDAMDLEQFQQVKALEEEFQTEGLYFSYETTDELRSILMKELTNRMERILGQEFTKKDKDDEAASEYDPDVDHERLQLSAAVHEEQDRRNIQRIVDYFEMEGITEPYRVFDAGCGYGTVTKDRFGNDDRFDVLGIDYVQSVIGVARTDYTADNIEYRVMDVRDIDEADPGTFDLVFASYLFHHLDRKAQESVLSLLWNRVRPGGALLVRSCDDGQHLHFPDDDGMDWVVEVTDDIKGSSDRKHGRRLFTHLQRLTPEPTDICLDLKNYHTAGATATEREQYWEVFHSNRLHYAKVLATDADATPADKRLYKRMQEEFDRLEAKFVDNPNFLDAKSVPLTVAYKPKPDD